MTQRFSYPDVAPGAFKAVMAIESYSRSTVDKTTLELLKLRASIINGCAFCVDMHTKDALAAGETTERLFAVAAWREAPYFTEPERAALALTDAVTKLGDHGVPDEVWEASVQHFGLEGAANLVLAIGTINVWNRMMIASQTPPAVA